MDGSRSNVGHRRASCPASSPAASGPASCPPSCPAELSAEPEALERRGKRGHPATPEFWPIGAKVPLGLLFDIFNCMPLPGGRARAVARGWLLLRAVPTGARPTAPGRPLLQVHPSIERAPLSIILICQIFYHPPRKLIPSALVSSESSLHKLNPVSRSIRRPSGSE